MVGAPGDGGVASVDGFLVAPPDGAQDGAGDLGLGLGGIDLLAGGLWVIPAASVAGPGLLVLLWLAIQAAGAAAWIPAVRRLRGEDRNR